LNLLFLCKALQKLNVDFNPMMIGAPGGKSTGKINRVLCKIILYVKTTPENKKNKGLE
jgi:hypothetical protein